MNWKRIFIYILIYFAATAAVAFPFGVVIGFMSSSGSPIPVWVGVGQPIAAILVSIVVFARLASIQLEKTFETAWSVGLISWVLSFIPNVIIFKQPFIQWFLSIAVITFCLLVGVFIGKRFQRKPSVGETG